MGAWSENIHDNQSECTDGEHRKKICCTEAGCMRRGCCPKMTGNSQQSQIRFNNNTRRSSEYNSTRFKTNDDVVDKFFIAWEMAF